MTPEEKMEQDAESNAKMIKYTYDELVVFFPDFTAGTLLKVATDVVSASIRCLGSYSV
jgi:hypothetical protein